MPFNLKVPKLTLQSCSEYDIMLCDGGEMANRRYGQYSEEYINSLRDFYVNNPVSLKELAAMTGSDEFPQAVDFMVLNFYCTQGRWGTLKQRVAHGKSGLPDTLQEEIEDLRELTYDTMMDAENRPAPRDLSSLMSAYMSLQAAGKIRGSSAKTSFQDALDLIQQVESGENGRGDNPPD